MIKTKLVTLVHTCLLFSLLIKLHECWWVFSVVGMYFRGVAFWGSTEVLLCPGSVFGRAFRHVSSLHHDTRMCQSQRHPEQGRGAVTPAEGPKCCCSLFSPAPLQDPESSRMRRVGLPEEGSALLLWKAALPWGSSSCYSCHHPHICLSSQLRRMAFSGCHPG